MSKSQIRRYITSIATAFLYESNGIVTEDFATYDTAFEAIAMAKARGWDEVVDDTTGEVVYRK